VEAAPAPWRTNPDRQGSVRRLTWGGLGHATAQWKPQWAALHRGSLHLLPSQDADDGDDDTVNVWQGRRIAVLDPDMVGGAEHCIAVVEPGDLSKAVHESSALVLQLDSDDEVRGPTPMCLMSRKQSVYPCLASLTLTAAPYPP